jgi:hypothetical protein
MLDSLTIAPVFLVMVGDGPAAESATSGRKNHRQPASLSPQLKDQHGATDGWHFVSSWMHVF